jgi:hypothetical protein
MRFALSGGLIALAFSLSAQGATPSPDASPEALVGQLIMASVDGSGYDGGGDSALPPAIHPDYYRMVRDLGIGAVLPHYSTRNALLIRASNRALASMSVPPLIIAADYIRLSAPSVSDPGLSAEEEFGDGFSGGAIFGRRRLSDAEFEDAAERDASVHRLLGFTMALGPTMDASVRAADSTARAAALVAAYERNGVIACVKHYPFVPAGFNLHRETRPLEYSDAELLALEAPFIALAPRVRAVMSTHVLAPAVDPLNAATFSRAWVDRLRSRIGYGGFLLSDGLFMAGRYGEPPMDPAADADWKRFGIEDFASRAAIAAILAGHDMVILEGTSADTRRVRDSLLRAYARGDGAGKAFRAAAGASYARVIALKEGMRTMDGPKWEDPEGRDARAALEALGL